MITPRQTRLVRVTDLPEFRRAITALCRSVTPASAVVPASSLPSRLVVVKRYAFLPVVSIVILSDFLRSGAPGLDFHSSPLGIHVPTNGSAAKAEHRETVSKVTEILAKQCIFVLLC